MKFPYFGGDMQRPLTVGEWNKGMQNLENEFLKLCEKAKEKGHYFDGDSVFVEKDYDPYLYDGINKLYENSVICNSKTGKNARIVSIINPAMKTDKGHVVAAIDPFQNKKIKIEDYGLKWVWP